MTVLEVRWLDGYLERFEDVSAWRAGISTLWIKHQNVAAHGGIIEGEQEWIPLVSVRRFKFSDESPGR